VVSGRVRGQGPLGIECTDARVAKRAIAASHGRSVLTACLLHSDVGEQLRVNDLHCREARARATYCSSREGTRTRADTNPYDTKANAAG
jgi:hypothetical protein